MGMNASIFNSSGVPRGAGVNSTFTVMLHNIESSLFDWRIFLGLHTDSWVYPLKVISDTYPGSLGSYLPWPPPDVHIVTTPSSRRNISVCFNNIAQPPVIAVKFVAFP
mmetsp:Transcript_8426/g.7662  ORF Transcript_8426/g.7662 Transcript_8426/m.7662 type:complete len:108 (-) Transcript_8426:15-338(-)